MRLRRTLRFIRRVWPATRRAEAEKARRAAIEQEQKDIWGMASGHPESKARQLSPAEEALMEQLIGREWPDDDYLKGSQ